MSHIEDGEPQPDGGEVPPLGRREFMAGVGVAAAAAAGALAGRAAGRDDTRPQRVPGSARRLGMLIDLDRCVGCQACSVACKAEHGVRLGGFRSWVSERELGRYPKVGRAFLPRLCNHCERAPCLDVCPTGATSRREDGLVAIDKARCIGCRHCMQACPYGARYFNEPASPQDGAFPALTQGTVDKCDFCAHRVDRGVVPACVNTCPAGARTFGDLRDLEGILAKAGAARSARPLLPERETRPAVLYKGGVLDAFQHS